MRYSPMHHPFLKRHLNKHPSWPLCPVRVEVLTGTIREPCLCDLARSFWPSSRGDYATNDVAGNFSVTLIDSIDSLVILNDKPGFEQAVRNIIHSVSFNSNTKPQVFETTIRVLGGLLSAHLLASNPAQPFYLTWYHDELLYMAHDLVERLLPAFKTQTGIPYARVSESIIMWS